ncbi:MAG: tRNA (guanosine(37)-N1)-methyltransferase TrmD [Planctomycetota bacterium]|nr:tRNA (guanosine(37)-N1)-methyltransferase TrmD [Planctomycetota bacterium]
MRFDLLTLFPDLFESYLQQSLLKKAIDRELVEIHRWNFRDWATGRHQSVDDKPYGGGPGMLIRCQPVFDCVEHVQQQGTAPGRLIMLTPAGQTLDQRLVESLSHESRFVLLCGRYEGFDDRIRQGLAPVEISIGDYITNGGEVPAMVLIETLIRLVPGVLGDETSSQYESFAESGVLEYPQFTRPREFRGMTVPDVLLNGNHAEIAHWRTAASLSRTRERRGPDTPLADERKEPGACP